MRYFEVDEDSSIGGRWHLEEPVYLNKRKVLDFWPLLAGTPVKDSDFKEINTPLQYEGRSLNWTYGGFMIPFVDRIAGAILLRIAPKDVRLLPCLIGGKDLGISVTAIQRKCRCLDYKKSQIDFYTVDDLSEEEEDDKDPGRLGSVKSVIKAKVNPQLILPDWHIFRLDEDLNHIIVSEVLRDALSEASITGIRFCRV